MQSVIATKNTKYLKAQSCIIQDWWETKKRIKDKTSGNKTFHHR